MEHDLTTRLRESAGPLPTLDEATLEQLVRTPHRRLHVAVSLLALGVLAVLIVSVANRTETVDLVGQPVNDAAAADELRDDDHEIVASTYIAPDLRAEGTWQVLGVEQTDGAGPDGVSLTQAELDEAWDAFDVDGDPPTLPTGQAAVLVSVAGDCTEASAVRGVEHIRALRPSGTFFAIHVDPTCAIIDRFGTTEPGPRLLVAVSIPNEHAETAVGAATVSAPVTSLDWDLLAVEVDTTGQFFGSGKDTQERLAATWDNGITGDVPQLSDERLAWLVPVPGSCEDPSSLRRVESMGYVYPHGRADVMLIMQFDPACATPSSGPAAAPQAVYAIELGVAVSDTLHGPRAFMTCPPDSTEAECRAEAVEETRTLEGERLIAITPWE